MVSNIKLDKLITYTNSVYEIGKKFKGLKRKNKKAKTKAETVSKMLFASLLCGHSSINEFNDTNKNENTVFSMLYSSNEYIPRTHGIRDCVIDTDYNQIKEINNDVIVKAKENKFFRNNTVDGLKVVAWDGVELNETTKDIKGLPEREYTNKEEIRKYIKYTVAMNVGEKANIIVGCKQHLEIEKIETKTGKERAKTTGETKEFANLHDEVKKKMGGIDVNVFDALYLNQNVIKKIDKNNEYFVIRLKDENREIYKDSEGLFNSRKADSEYEIVEYTTVKDIKYSKNAKKKNQVKTKVKKEKRKITDKKLGEKKLIDEKLQTKKNSTIKIKKYEKVITRKQVWDDEFELTGYNKNVRVLKSLEISGTEESKKVQEIRVVTNMLNHDVETILKIMHYRWNIENCGFRTLKQRYNLGHIYIGVDINAINYIIQMIFLVFNLLELYMKIRLKEKIKITYSVIRKIFERELHYNKNLNILFNSA